MFHIALHEPKMPANTGNIIRLCANNGCSLHLIEPLGFDFEEKKLRRAGLDYHDLSNVKRYPDYASFKAAMGDRRIFACTTKGSSSYAGAQYAADDVLLFGSETSGLPDSILAQFTPEFRIRIPMMPNNRSLNLSNAVAVISFEAWRQQQFAGGC
ncbi:tRNA (uridine(34)/cytosine(34)/5-carboxymethylaminomethyluridine(34)-2'-O)-methyltransferase TrmL [Pseudidiomarina aestuarii]|uniref:tRNA (cytidine(34)-2'-O)-methyltransferase n=1 Tax=Pseudidiomarina aestuarii TaxID=624146 RepID=A0A7Z7ESV3_9GAMM|nr:tRNA (cytidine(34)-2'-O)-methyltransferase [Pseudidiomarina aestuarii]RUO39413.1 tRNA (uridine(34)/cytosine(34)/5-carboxymethylaminomethyluridine(34)-2'-O)-methyltransferase TrmL [Pseudidiomarina aestuarii]